MAVISINRKKRGRSRLFLLGVGLILLGFSVLGVSFFTSYNPGKLVISAPFNLGQYEFTRAELSEKELDISWKLYIQLVSRKAAIPIEEDDIIVEVYDSWYQLFSTTREYLLEMQVQEIEHNKNAQQIVQLSLDVLNKGMRPHLTKWQGKYRKWYTQALEDPNNKDLSPQEIQKKYPDYKELVKEMKAVNTELIAYADELKKFSHEKPPNISSRITSRIRLFFQSL